MRIEFLCHAHSKFHSDAHIRGDVAYTDPGNQDSPLTFMGQQQCYAWARGRAPFVPKWDIVFTSSLTRCLQTTQEVLREIPGETPIVTDFLLGQQGGGLVINQRKSRDAIRKEFSGYELMIPDEPLLHYTSPPETREQMVQRMQFIVGLARQMEGENVLIVADSDLIEAYSGHRLLPCEAYSYVWETSRS